MADDLKLDLPDFPVGKIPPGELDEIDPVQFYETWIETRKVMIETGQLDLEEARKRMPVNVPFKFK